MFRNVTGWAFLAGVLTVALVAQTGTGQDRKTEQGGKADAKSMPLDQQFLQKAFVGNVKEIVLGNIAVKQAKSEEVRDFGERMIKAHSKANQKVVALLKEHKADLDESKLKMELKKAVEKVATHQGEAFDKAYMQVMVMSHQKSLDMYQNQAQNGKQNEIVQYAKETLPSIRDHLQQAKQLAGKVGAGKGATDGAK